jgi:hypothetical protein
MPTRFFSWAVIQDTNSYNTLKTTIGISISEGLRPRITEAHVPKRAPMSNDTADRRHGVLILSAAAELAKPTHNSNGK